MCYLTCVLKSLYTFHDPGKGIMLYAFFYLPFPMFQKVPKIIHTLLL